MGVCLLLIFISVCYGKGVTILSPPEIAGEILTGPLQSFDFDVNGELALAQIDCTDFVATEQYQDKIVLFTVAISDTCYHSISHYIDLATSWNATGCIIMESGGLVGFTVRQDDGDYKTRKLPAVTISAYEGGKIASYLNRNEVVEVNIQTPKTNPYTEFVTGPAGIFFQFTMELFGFICLVAASWKLYGFKSFPVFVCISTIDFLIAIVRMIYGIDMQMYRFIWDPTTELFLSNTYLPVSFAATLLIIFYWCDLINNLGNYGTKISRRLRNLRIPFIVVATLVFILVIIADSIRSAKIPMPLSSLLSAIVLSILTFLLSIFFFVTGYRVLRPYASDKKQFLLKRITWYFMGCGLALFIKSLDIFIAVALLNAATPSSLTTYFWVTHMLAYLVTGTQILAFQRPKVEKVSGSTSEKTTTAVRMETINISSSVSV